MVVLEILLGILRYSFVVVGMIVHKFISVLLYQQIPFYNILKEAQ